LNFVNSAHADGTKFTKIKVAKIKKKSLLFQTRKSFKFSEIYTSKFGMKIDQNTRLGA